MSDLLLWLILAAVVINAVVAIALLLRTPQSSDGPSSEVREDLRATREESRAARKEFREEVSGTLKSSAETIATTLHAVGKGQQIQLESMTKKLDGVTESNSTALDRIQTTINSRVKELQEGNEKKLGEMRKEASDGLKSTNETLSKALDAMGTKQHSQLEAMAKNLQELTESNRTSLDRIRSTFDARVKELQEGNEKKLDEMRKTVDEKLHDTLEKRLGESFKLVSDRLEAVHQGLGEMQTLATGVGDLKRVLSNVKVRGTWAEVQLGALLEQFLTADQYGTNVCVKEDSMERVEFAVRLPGSKGDPDWCVWLPIDSKFPQEDYLRLQEAAERGDTAAVESAAADLARTVRGSAREIFDKYVNPPNTTDFAIMFLPTEGLHAEVLRQPALVEQIQQQYRIVLAGPTTLVAILSSLRMGFQTLAIEQHASQVWRVLGAVKTEFGKFGDVLDRVKKHLNTASRTIEQTGVRSRAIERKLRSVEHVPDAEASSVLALSEAVSLIDILDSECVNNGDAITL